MNFKFLLFIFVFPCFISGAEPISQSDKNNLQVAGVILRFHNWPDPQEEKAIVTYLKNEGLVKKIEIKNFKMLAFSSWPQLIKATEAQQLCEKISQLSNIPSLKYCEPDHIVKTTSDNKIPPVKPKSKTPTEEPEPAEQPKPKMSTNVNEGKGGNR